MFTPSSLPRDLRPHQKSSITYRVVWCPITHPLLKKDEACGFFSDRLIKMDSASMESGQMTAEQWTNMGINIATDILPIRGTCLGVTRLSVSVSQELCCDPLFFNCTALPSLSWPLTPTLLSSAAGTVLNLDLGFSDAFPGLLATRPKLASGGGVHFSLVVSSLNLPSVSVPSVFSIYISSPFSGLSE